MSAMVLERRAITQEIDAYIPEVESPVQADFEDFDTFSGFSHIHEL
jgi:hypothetical protein